MNESGARKMTARPSPRLHHDTHTLAVLKILGHQSSWLTHCKAGVRTALLCMNRAELVELPQVKAAEG